MKTKSGILAFLLVCVTSLFAQSSNGTAGNYATFQTLNLLAQSTNCSVPQSCIWEKMPPNALVTAITLSGTFSIVGTVEASADGGNTFPVTLGTCSAAATTTYTTSGYTDVRCRITTYTSGLAVASYNTTVSTGAQIVTQTSTGGLPSGSVAPSILQAGLLADCITNSGNISGTVLTCQTATGTLTCTWNTAPTTVSNGVTLTGTQDASCPASLNSSLTMQCFVNYQSTAATSAGFFFSDCVAGDGNNANNVGIQWGLTSVDSSTNGSQPLVSFGNGSAQASAVATLNGAGCLAIRLQSGQPDALFINGNQMTGPLVSSSFGDQTAGVYHIGGSAAGSGSLVNSHFFGTIAEVLFYSSQLSANDIQKNCQTMAVRYGSGSMVRSGDPALPPGVGSTDTTNEDTILGDSISALPWSQKTSLQAGLNDQTAVIVRDGANGEQMQQNSSDEPFVTHTHFHPRGVNTIHIWAGTNDVTIGSRTPFQAYQDMRATAISARTGGFKVLVSTMISRSGTGTGGVTADALKNQLNAFLRPCVQQNWCDYLNDNAAIPVIGADGASANATNFPDGIHPATAISNNTIAPEYLSSVNRMLGCHDFSCAQTYSNNGGINNSFLSNVAGNDTNSATPSNSQTTTYPFNFHKGDMAFVCAQWTGSTITLTVADTNSSSWNSLGVITNGTARTHCYYAFNAAAGPDIVTFTFSGAGGTSISTAVTAYHGVNSIDQSTTATGSSTSPAAGSVTTAKNSELVIVYAGGTGLFNNLSAPTGYAGRITNISCPQICTLNIADQENVATGAINPTWTTSNSPWEAGIATFYMGGSTVTQQDEDTTLSLGAITANTSINLIPATGYTGQTININNANTSANTWTLAANGSETINGAATYAVSSQKQPICLVSTLVSASSGGDNWLTCGATLPPIAPCLLASAASPLACGSATQGKVAIPVSQATYTVNTTGVYSGAIITLTPTTDNTGIPGAPSCVLPTLTADPSISATSAGVSFTIAETSTASITCYAWKIN